MSFAVALILIIRDSKKSPCFCFSWIIPDSRQLHSRFLADSPDHETRGRAKIEDVFIY